MQKSTMYGSTKSIKRVRFTLIWWYPGYRREYKCTRRLMALSTFARLFLTEVLATGQSKRGLSELVGSSRWGIRWTFKKYVNYKQSFGTLLSTSQKRHRTLRLNTCAVSRPVSVSAVLEQPAMVHGELLPACFARTCRKAGICMMQINGCKYPTHTGKLI